MSEVVKVQLPIGMAGVPQRMLALVYARGGCDVRLQHLDDATLDALGDDPKGYFEGELGAREWAIGQRVAEQPW